MIPTNPPIQIKMPLESSVSIRRENGVFYSVISIPSIDGSLVSIQGEDEFLYGSLVKMMVEMEKKGVLGIGLYKSPYVKP